MKKLWLVSILSFGLILLAGCNTWKPTEGAGDSWIKQESSNTSIVNSESSNFEIFSTYNESDKISNSNEMISIYNESNEMTCNLVYNAENEEWISVMYVKDWMISQKTESTFEWEKMIMYTLAKDNKIYVWWNVYGEWIWMSASYEINMEDELKWFDEVEDSTKVYCIKWVKDDSVFNLPTDIEFTSVDDWLDNAED